jgi:hypothetical protein
MDNFNPKKIPDIMDDEGAYVGKRRYLTEEDDFTPQKNEFVSEQFFQSSVVELKSLTK